MSTTYDETTASEESRAGATPRELGVGMRLSIHPHCDDFVDVILGALGDVETAGLTEGLVTETDEVSSYVGAHVAPAEQRLATYLCAVIGAASRRSGGGHVVAHVLLSRGCPGEVACDLQVTGLPAVDPVALEATGVRASAQWSLYPLLDGGSDAPEHADAAPPEMHMAHIEAAIDAAQRGMAARRGTAATPAHYATKLTGDVADVVATAVDAWAQVGAVVPHVVTHLTISVGSPSQTTSQAGSRGGPA